MNPLKMVNGQAQGLDLKRNFDLWKAGELLLKITCGSKSDSQEAKYKEMRKTFLQTPKELRLCIDKISITASSHYKYWNRT